MDEGTQFLVTSLEHLMSLPRGSKAERDAWYVESKRVQKALRELFADLDYRNGP
jgi:hypothetical protein